MDNLLDDENCDEQGDEWNDCGEEDNEQPSAGHLGLDRTMILAKMPDVGVC